jgi:hypothetical protein
MFTVVAMTHRELEPLFSPVVYPVASNFGVTTFAQAIFYNSNEQQAPEGNMPSTVQPKVAWDTLNWAPTASPPEWGAEASVAPDTKWPWEIFERGNAYMEKAAARLNWQAKLMPVTKTRFEKAIGAAFVQTRDEKMTASLGAAWPRFDSMVTH